MGKDVKKTILILSSSFGQGHLATAKALKNVAINHPELLIDVKIIDFSEEISKLFNKTSKKLYEINTKHLPALYKWMYVSTDITHTPIRLANLLSYPLRQNHLRNLLSSYSPDLIISNYPVWQYLALQISKKSFPNVEFSTLITDSISVHSSWTIPDSDFYLVANEPTASSLHQLGVDNNKIFSLGYPVHESFMNNDENITSILSKMRISMDREIILFSASALRAPYVLRVIQAIDTHYPETTLVVVTGRDKELHRQIKECNLWKTPNRHLIGWTNNMPQLIKASDIVITKAGGSTVMECIAAKKPLIINKVIPGQEEGNAELVERYKIGHIARKSSEIITAISEIKKDYQAYVARLAEISHPEAAYTILHFLATRLTQDS
jgi:processive 1,2-diacylglycerol beta-glucosyltransferase